MDSLIRVFQKNNFTSFLSVYSKLLFSRLSFPTVFGDFQAAFIELVSVRLLPFRLLPFRLL